jgi:hypothetical protein
VHCIYKSNLRAFLLLSLTTKFFIPAIHLFTALGLSSGSTGNTSTEGSAGRERGVIGTELSSSVVDTSVVNAGVFWRGLANVFRGNLPGNGVGGVENKYPSPDDRLLSVETSTGDELDRVVIGVTTATRIERWEEPREAVILWTLGVASAFSLLSG